MTADDSLLEALSDRDVVALTLFGEARDQGPEGRMAVACVIRNRAAVARAGWGLTAREVCLKPLQFSCWNDDGGANHGVVMATALHLSRGEAGGPILRECQWIAAALFDPSLTFVDSTHGASHYLTTELFDHTPPSWARGAKPLARIGAHVFLRVA